MSDAGLIPTERLLATARPPQPYPGLRPFEMEEWSIFFGRERMIDDVIDKLGQQRLVVVHGSSGSGKSSLIRAGVLPRLARQHLRHGVPWRTATMRPSGGPLWNLATALAAVAGAEGDIDRVEAIRRAFDRPTVRLQRVIADGLSLAGQRVCLLVDQFEELFRYAKEISRDESQLFIELLTGLLEDGCGGRVHAVITMRSEFLGECARYDGLAEAINRCQYLLPRMDRDALTRAIRRPAELYGGEIDEALAARLIAEADGGQDELPLIQHALMLLWREVAGNGAKSQRLSLENYRGHKGEIASILSNHADSVLKSLKMRTGDNIIKCLEVPQLNNNEESYVHLSWWHKYSSPSGFIDPGAMGERVIELMFRSLIGIDIDGQAVRRPQRFDKLVAATGSNNSILMDVIDCFREEGVSFLTPYAPVQIYSHTIIEVSHESLIRCWRRISDPANGWMQREFQDYIVWRSMLARADNYVLTKKDLLPHGLITARYHWFHNLPPAWCERYGGGYQNVNTLIAASFEAHENSLRREARNASLVASAVIALTILLVAMFIVFNVKSYIVYSISIGFPLIFSAISLFEVHWEIRRKAKTEE